MRISLFIASVAGQGVVYIGYGGYLCGDRYIIADKSVRIAFSVIPFVMPSAYFIRLVNQRIILLFIEFCQHICADDGMGFHYLKFFRRQPSGLIEYLIVYRYLSYIVKR